jgi:hypothetical protein
MAQATSSSPISRLWGWSPCIPSGDLAELDDPLPQGSRSRHPSSALERSCTNARTSRCRGDGRAQASCKTRGASYSCRARGESEEARRRTCSRLLVEREIRGPTVGRVAASERCPRRDAPGIYDSVAPVYVLIDDMNAQANNHQQGGHDNVSDETAREMKSLRSRITSALRALEKYYSAL